MATKTAASSPSDAILPMVDKYMQEIVRREKSYEFRKYRIKASVSRVWFYSNAPLSSIVYVCEIDPARTRGHGQPPLPEDGRGNCEFNTFHKDWEGYDFAYRIRSVRRLRQPLTLARLKETYGFKLAPRGLVYLPPKIAADVPWQEQELVWRDDGGSDETPAAASPDTGSKPAKRKRAADSTARPAKKRVRARRRGLMPTN